jgi:hypothetical protein
MANQTILNIKTFLNSMKPESTTITDAVLIQLINEVDGSIHYGIYKEKLVSDISLVANTAEYDLPTGVTFDLIDQVYLNDIPLIKIDESYKDTTGYLRGSTNSKVKLYPVPEESDKGGNKSLRIVYLKPFAKHTATSDTVLVSAPHDKIYYEYCSAKISLFNENTATYNNMITIYNASLAEYEQWCKERLVEMKE